MNLREWKRQMRAVLDRLPDDGSVTHNNIVFNLSIRDENGDWLGYIDILMPEESSLP